ncbi:hypothetical protein [Dyella acidisoli]|uniref:Bulb-type lectin domain-containing protein n=1 Tax=Dyella acidisoli TaxID=1867834 RepID=A0ABQ5XRW7_9GAMM|nr:hypothetical protein [Dyella acidisoli]GLQ93240.1 hypothetical protein GCM10007901_21910 [Dyella acidisoli]
MGDVKAPAGGLASNSNYLINSDCSAVTGLTVSIKITQEIFVPLGMSFQLNAYSAQNANCVYQQYVFMFVVSSGGNPSINWMIDNWPSVNYGQQLKLPPNFNFINHQGQLFKMGSATPTLPAGYSLTIALANDGAGNVTGVTFSMDDGHGHTPSTGLIDLLGLPVTGSPIGAKVDSTGLAPIHAFELNIVGQDNGEVTLLQSGAGTITYAATSPLTVSNSLPDCVSAAGTVTEETSNSVYGGLPAGPSASTTQSFNAPQPTIPPGAHLASSQRFGAAAQTEVYMMGGAGQLQQFQVTGTGGWSGPTGYGPAGLAPPGAAVAASEQFGGGGQTDVFTVGNNGQLQVYWAKANGGFNGPVPIGPTGFAPAGAHLVASQEFSVTNQTDAFVVAKSGQLSVFSVQSLGNWSGPRPIGPSHFAPPGAGLAAGPQFGCPNQTNVWVVDSTGRLVVFWTNQPGQWNGPVPISAAGFAPPGARLATSQQFGCDNQTNVWVVDSTGRLVVFWVENAGAWNGPVAISAPGFAPPGASMSAIQQFGCDNQTDVFVVDVNGRMNVFWVENAGSWNGPVQVSPPGFAPPGSPVTSSQQFGASSQTDLFCVNNAGLATVSWVQSAGSWGGPALM